MNPRKSEDIRYSTIFHIVTKHIRNEFNLFNETKCNIMNQYLLELRRKSCQTQIQKIRELKILKP